MRGGGVMRDQERGLNTLRWRCPSDIQRRRQAEGWMDESGVQEAAWAADINLGIIGI